MLVRGIVKNTLQSLNAKELIVIKHFYNEKFKHSRSIKELINGNI
jgi:hemoglobin-like flavoprotein